MAKYCPGGKSIWYPVEDVTVSSNNFILTNYSPACKKTGWAWRVRKGALNTHLVTYQQTKKTSDEAGLWSAEYVGLKWVRHLNIP